MRTIQKELGEGDEGAAEIAELEKAIAEATMPEEVEKQARKELKRLERMPEGAGEYSMVRTYLDWLIELPWKRPSRRRSTSPRRGASSTRTTTASRRSRSASSSTSRCASSNPTGRSPILCFVGPPGVGKTSLGQSIAKATGRKFVRVSLGGVHDEAEIRGHRRTYIGALPGNIIQSMRKAGHAQLRDDARRGRQARRGGFHGDPASALLEVLDPEQNSTFRDNYLGVPFDLSRVMFICTANVLDTIPGPLRDRMEIIQLPGYTEQEKLQIARRYLVARQLEANGLTAGAVRDHATTALRDDHRRLHARGGRAQSRARDRQRCSATSRCASPKAASRTVTIDVPTTSPPILGPRKFEAEVAMRSGVPGRRDRPRVDAGRRRHPVHRGHAHAGHRQADPDRPARRRDEGKRAGGAVARQGARGAARHRSGRCSRSPTSTSTCRRARRPKDGPSAGVAMFIALASLLTERPVRSDVAMTGEISLRGLVLPIGGVKEKVLAALRAGITTVMLPARNRKDLDDIPANAREKLQFVWLETVDDAARPRSRRYASSLSVPKRSAELALLNARARCLRARRSTLARPVHKKETARRAVNREEERDDQRSRR